MVEGSDGRGGGRRLNGKWLVVIIVAAAMIVAVVAGKYTRYRLPPSSQPVQGEE